MTLDSAILLPGLALAPPGAQPVLTIELGRVGAHHGAYVRAGPGWRAGPGLVTLDIPGIARMQARDGRQLTVEVGDGATAGDAAAFAQCTGLGLLLHQRGEILMRGTAVQVGDRAALLLGEPGVGASTLAMALGRAGHALVADDLCRITTAPDGALQVEASRGSCQLWRKAIDALSLQERAGVRVRDGIDRFHVAPPRLAEGPVVLRDVIALRDSTSAHPPGWSSLPPLKTAVMLYVSAYRQALVAPLGLEQAQFRAMAALMRQVPVRTLSVPRALGRLPETVAMLDGQWA
ncbi:MAG: hypothetical protein V4537_05525 [Pseudomonadota bacterium]